MPYLELQPTGRADDLLGILVRAEERRYARQGVVMPDKPASRRAWVEPLGNLLGRLLYGALSLMPNATLARLQLGGFQKASAPDNFPFEPDSPRLAEARRLHDALAANGSRPALLCVFTHPPVTGKWLNLNVELTRQALWALGHVRGGTCRPSLIVAVDPFALDGFGLLMEGAYAGCMGGLHLGFDRLASHRGALSRILVGGTSWARVAGRVLRRLRGGGEVGIPLGGGVPTTSRALYSAKEFVWALRRGSGPNRPSPERARKALEAHPGFRAFAASGLVGPRLRANAWRMAEAWIMAVVSGAWGDDASLEDGGPSVDRGALTPEARASALACAKALGASDPDARVAELQAELSRETPYRTRLFRILTRRLAGRGTPLVLVPLSHRRGEEVRMDWGEPAAVVGARGETLELLGVDGSRRTRPIAEFARAFVDRNLP